MEGADGGLVPAERRGEVAAQVEEGGGGQGGLGGGGGVAAEEERAEHDGDHEGGEDEAQGDRALLALGQSGSDIQAMFDQVFSHRRQCLACGWRG